MFSFSQGQGLDRIDMKEIAGFESFMTTIILYLYLLVTLRAS